MSQENVEVGRRIFDALNRRDVDAFVAFFTSDVVFEENPVVPGLRDVYRGRTEVREWMAAVLEAFEDLQVEVVEIRALADDRVFAENFATARGKGSGVPVEFRFWTVARFTERKVTRRQVFWTRGEALEAAGLSE